MGRTAAGYWPLLQVVANQKRLSAAQTLVAQVTDERYGRNILE
jgi:hypothetical protein